MHSQNRDFCSFFHHLEFIHLFECNIALKISPRLDYNKKNLFFRINLAMIQYDEIFVPLENSRKPLFLLNFDHKIERQRLSSVSKSFTIKLTF